MITTFLTGIAHITERNRPSEWDNILILKIAGTATSRRLGVPRRQEKSIKIGPVLIINQNLFESSQILAWPVISIQIWACAAGPPGLMGQSLPAGEGRLRQYTSKTGLAGDLFFGIRMVASGNPQMLGPIIK